MIDYILYTLLWYNNIWSVFIFFSSIDSRFKLESALVASKDKMKASTRRFADWELDLSQQELQITSDTFRI